MSNYTLSRLPDHILHIFKIYERASNNALPYKNVRIKNYLQRTTPEYNNFQRQKLLTDKSEKGKFNPNDFPPIISTLIKPIFEGSLDLGELENMRTEDIFKQHQDKKEPRETDNNEVDFTPIISSASRTTKNFTDYQAQIASSFAAYFSPYRSVPKVNLIKNSFQWYQRLLNNTPIIFVLRQTNRLFSESSLSQVNKPLNDFKTAIMLLQNSFADESDKTIRNYHFTDLSTVDLFSLANKSQRHFQSDKDFEKLFASADWKTENNVNDKLSEALVANKSVELTDRSFNTVNVSPHEIINKFPIHKVLKELEYTNVREVFPYDIKYHDYHLLTIENPIIQDDHSKLLNILEAYKNSFEIISVRMGLNNQVINDFFSQKVHASDTVSTSKSYDELLQIAKSRHDEAGQKRSEISSIDTLMKRLGEFGLVRVEEGFAKNCIYLFHKH